ncbi:O-antigen ligase family protein [Mariniflexile gromovii]|uniref:O-antigen ligase family protein n=1 Tax=Mariniflexile gromovii TaxID=362523 RepID=A0ABS4BQJ3_9FLAO|nr:O-antigen ligase family protein [Mariniflexile gromovii]MBP0902855.1 O-antigen ligase family protein [Mariniflexile gromovii]
MRTSEIFNKIRNDYNLDLTSLLLYLFISFSFLDTYKLALPFIFGILFYQILLVYKKKIETMCFINQCWYLLVFSLVFFRSVHTIILLIIILFILLNKNKLEKRSLSLSLIKFEVYILAFFVLIILNNLCHQNYLKGIDTFLYLLLYPILFIILKKFLFQISLIKTIKVFITSVLISLFYLIIINILYADNLLEINTYFSDFLDLTHVYYGMFLGLSCSFFMYFKTKGFIYVSSRFDVLLYLIFVFFIIYIGARISFFAVVIITLLSLYKTNKLAWYKKITILSALFFGILFLSLKLSPRISHGFESMNNLYISINKNDKHDLINNSWANINERYLVWSYSIKELKSNIIYGIGVKNVKDVISNQILNDGYIYYQPKNSHNQYLHFLLGFGIFGFIYFLYIIYVFFKKVPQGTYFLVFFLIIMLTESVLVRVKGMSLFFIFILIFSYNKANNICKDRLPFPTC